MAAWTGTISCNQSGTNAQKNGKIQIYYSAGGGSITIHKIRGNRPDGYRTYGTSGSNSITINIGGHAVTRACSHIAFGANTWEEWTDFDDYGVSLSGNQTVTISIASYNNSAYVPVGSSWTTTIDGGVASVWNDINAYQPGSDAQNGLIFDLRLSNGDAWSNLTNEPASFTYPIGTVATISNVRPNVAGSHFSSISGASDIGSGQYQWTFSTANHTVHMYSAWNTYYRDINAWNPDRTVQGAVMFDYYIYNRDGTLVDAYYNVTNEVANTVTREYGYTCRINNIRSNLTGAHYSSNNITNNASGDFTTTFNNTNAIELYTAWNTYSMTVRTTTGVADITNPPWAWTNGYKTGTVTYGQSFRINVSLHTGYHFSHWSGSVNTTTKDYTFTIGAQNYDVTANAAPNTYTVVYNGNGNTGGSTSNSSHTYDRAQNLTTNGFTKIGHHFLGWATSASGAVVYNNAQSVMNLTATHGGTVYLYAIWEPNQYTITYNDNGGTGGPGQQTYTYASSGTCNLSTVEPVRENYIFLGWGTTPDTEEVQYMPGAPWSLSIASNTTLYAVWEFAQSIVCYKENGQWITGYLYMKSNGVWERSRTIYKKENNKWIQY